MSRYDTRHRTIWRKITNSGTFFSFSGDMKNSKITYLMTWVVSLQFIGRMFDVKAKAASEAKRLVFDVILFVLVSSWPSSTQLELTIGNALRKWELSAFYYIVQSYSFYCIVSSPGHKNWGHWWGWLTSIVGGHEWLIFYLKIWKMGKIFYSCLVGQK